MSLFATEKVPSPVVMTGVVGRDLQGRTLTVRLSELASGYERLHWKTAHRALLRAEETGWRNARTVWASAPGAYQVAPVNAAPDGTLLVHFPSGEQAFQTLIGKPGLFAYVSADRSAGTFIAVRFSNRTG
jgi:hypothetical protein